MNDLILASTSAARGALLRGAGVSFTAEAPGVDEGPPKTRLLKEGATPQRVAEMLAALKAMTVSARRPGLVIGADQTLDLDGELIDKAPDIEAARYRLLQLRGRRHRLHSAVVVAQDGAPIWRLTGTASLSMRVFTPEFLDGYVARNPGALTSSVGAYQLEGEGAQLFDAIEGDYFTILGLPLLPLLEFLRTQGVLPS